MGRDDVSALAARTKPRTPLREVSELDRISYT